MDKHQQYINDKTMLAYGKYIRGEFFQKVRSIIIKDGKIAFVKDIKTGEITIPGGGVDEGETIEQACAREALEESGYEVKPILSVDSNEYEVNMSIGSLDFVSKRVEYFYICDFIKVVSNKSLGLDGEYEDGVDVFFDSVDKLKEYYKISDEAILNIKKYIESKQK